MIGSGHSQLNTDAGLPGSGGSGGGSVWVQDCFLCTSQSLPGGKEFIRDNRQID